MSNTSTGPARATSIAAFASMLVVVFLAAMDATVVATALPAIASDLGAGADVAWIVSSFLLATAVSIPVWGKLADLVPRRSLYLTAAVAFVAASALVAVSPTTSWLVGARAMQGLATGGLMTLTPTIVGVLFPAEIRGRYQGIQGAVLAGASVAGPLVGGVVVDGPGWRWAFAVNVPLGLAAVLVVVRWLRLPPSAAGARRVDVVGALLVVLGVLALLLALGESAGATTGTARAVLLATAAAAAVAYVAWQRRHPDPIVPLRILADPVVRGGVLLSLTAGASMLVVTVHLPLFAQTVGGSSATAAGLVLLPLTLGVMVASVAGGVIVTALGRYRPVLVAGTAATAAGVALLSQEVVLDHVLSSVVALVLVGAGVGLTMQPALLAVQNAAVEADLGAATASTAFFRQLGGTLAIGGLGGLLAARAGAELAMLETGESLTGAATDVLSQAITGNLAVAAAVAALAVVTALRIPERALGRAVAEEPPSAVRGP